LVVKDYSFSGPGGGDGGGTSGNVFGGSGLDSFTISASLCVITGVTVEGFYHFRSFSPTSLVNEFVPIFETLFISISFGTVPIEATRLAGMKICS